MLTVKVYFRLDLSSKLSTTRSFNAWPEVKKGFNDIRYQLGQVKCPWISYSVKVLETPAIYIQAVKPFRFLALCLIKNLRSVATGVNFKSCYKW